MSSGKIILITVLAGALSIAAALLSDKWLAGPEGTTASTAVRVEKPIDSLPAFKLPDLDGREHASNSWAGKVLVLNFWATWCPPCLREMPLFVDLQKEYQGEGVQFVAVAIDDKSAVMDSAASHSINFPILLGDLETVALSRQLGNRLEGLPFTAIFDRFGKLVYSRAGEMTRSSLEQNLQAMLEAER